MDLRFLDAYEMPVVPCRDRRDENELRDAGTEVLQRQDVPADADVDGAAVVRDEDPRVISFEDSAHERVDVVEPTCVTAVMRCRRRVERFEKTRQAHTGGVRALS